MSKVVVLSEIPRRLSAKARGLTVTLKVNGPGGAVPVKLSVTKDSPYKPGRGRMRKVRLVPPLLGCVRRSEPVLVLGALNSVVLVRVTVEIQALLVIW